MKKLGRTFMAIGLMVTGAAGSAKADVLLSGPDSNDGTYSTASLSTLAIGSDTVSDGGTGLTGISAWGLLAGASATSPTSPVYGGITTSTPAGDNGKNAILRYYLLGTSASGAQSIVSLGEIDPGFGNTSAFIAFQSNTSGQLAAPELVVPGAPGRDLTNLTSLQLLSVAALPAGGGGPSTSVQLSGNVKNPGNETLSQLQTDFTPVQENVSGDTYTGVLLWTFLDPTDSNITDQIVTTQGTDGYEVVLALAEIDPALGGNPADLLPYADAGTDFPTDGVARTIYPTDNKHGRWESNLDFVQVSSVPEPSSLILLTAALIPVTIATRRPKTRITQPRA
jgi:hypothetical protein